MAKKRKEHEGCSYDNPKRSKVLNETVTSESETILYVPDTPLDKIKEKKHLDLKTDAINGEKLQFSENDEDEFSDSDIDLGDLDVEGIQSTYDSYSRYARYQVIHVDDNGSTKTVQCQCISTKDSVTVTVSGEWYYSEIIPGNFLHIIDTKPNSKQVTLPTLMRCVENS